MRAVLWMCGVGAVCGCQASYDAEARREAAYHEREVCARVMSVGYSDDSGWAGVLLDNGTHLVVRHPVVGAQACYLPPDDVFDIPTRVHLK